jgi:hypothetical protein
VPRDGAAPTFAACALLLSLGFFARALRRLMATVEAPGAGAENAMMAGMVPGNATDGGTLKQPAACTGAAIPPAAITTAEVAGSNMNFIRVSGEARTAAPSQHP